MNLKILVAGVMTLASVTVTAAQVDHGGYSAVLSDHVRDGSVDYTAIAKDDRFADYITQLQLANPEEISDEAHRLAFWINAYNAFTIKLVLDNLPVQSIREISEGETGPWDIVWISIGGKEYSLNQIEHEIIRPEFQEPLIHMALVCAAVSCPPLLSEAYRGDRLQEQMVKSARLFLSDTTKNRYDAESGILVLSELFRWYGDDFIKRYGSAARFALGTMGRPDTVPKAVRYLPYDWSLNGRR